MFTYPVLFGDIGGTNARFAVQDAPGAPLDNLPRVATGSFPDPGAAIAHALLSRPGPPPRSAILALAAPVDRAVVRLTNASWTFDAALLGEALGLDRVAFVNDYTPVAACLAALADDDLDSLGEPRAAGRGPRVVLGPGTGLGAAALVPAGDRQAVVSTEAGHVELGPASAREEAVWRALEPVEGRITAEAVLSGPGLVRLHRAVAASLGARPVHAEPSAVCLAGLDGSDPVCAGTLELFCTILGRFAGDLALIYGATGGVYIGSGIAPRMLPVLRRGGFRRAFEAKAPHEGLMRRIPAQVVLHPEPALLGLAALAADPDGFAFERVEVLRA